MIKKPIVSPDNEVIESIENMLNVSFVIPAFNEEETIQNVISGLKKVVLNVRSLSEFEIIVVDDGSTDSTLEQAAREDVTLIKHPERLGYGASLKAAIKRAKFEWIFIIDADNAFPSDSIPELLNHAADYSMVVGARVGKDVSAKPLNRIAKALLKRLVFILTGKKVPDLNSGMRIFQKDKVQKLFPIIGDGFSFTTTITVAFLSDGHSIKYIPVQFKERTSGASKIRPLKDMFSFVITILRTITYFNPLAIFLRLTLFFGALLTVSLFLDLFIFSNLSDTTTLLLVSTLFFFSFGLLADLINRRCPR